MFQRILFLDADCLVLLIRCEHRLLILSRVFHWPKINAESQSIDLQLHQYTSLILFWDRYSEQKMFFYVCFKHVINCLCTLIQYCNFRTLNWRVFHSIWLIYFEETDPIVKSYLIFFNKKSEKVFRIFKINKVLNSIGMDFFEQMVFFFMRIAYICIYLNKPTPTTYSSTFLNEFFLFIFVSHLKNSWNCKWKKKCLSAHWN